MHCEDSSFPGINCDGGYAEYIKTTARSCIKLDDSLEPVDVAALADAGLTAQVRFFQLIEDEADTVQHVCTKAAKNLRPGYFVIMIGAGGLGHIGIQVMKAISAATLIVIDRNPEALALAKKIGADHTILGDDKGEFVKKALELTNGQGAEAVIDFVAEGGSTSTGVKMLRRAGDYYIVGYGENINVPTIDIVRSSFRSVDALLTWCRSPPKSTSSETWLDLTTIWLSSCTWLLRARSSCTRRCTSWTNSRFVAVEMLMEGRY